jgi:hypothetical protein
MKIKTRTAAAFFAMAGMTALSAPAFADNITVEAGPIWSQADAEQKCPPLAAQQGGSWTGGWWTTVQGSMSVCEVSRPTPEQICAGLVQDRVAWNHAGQTRWNDTNVQNLCAATPYPQATVSCFQAMLVIHND